MIIDPEFVVAQSKTEHEVIEIAKNADGILNQYAPITERVIKSLDRCKVICRYGVGVDSIDVEVATERGIIVANVPGYYEFEIDTMKVMKEHVHLFLSAPPRYSPA